MLLVTFFLAAVFPNVAVFFPSTHDKDGWGLRVHGLSNAGPFLAKELIDLYRFNISLINFSDKERFHDPLPAAYQSLALDVVVLDPNGLQPHGGAIPEFNRGGRDPFTVQAKAHPGGVSSLDFHFIACGYSQVFSPGRHRIEAKFEFNTDGKLDGRVVKAPRIEFEVLPLKAETILSSHRVPLEGREAKLPMDEQYRPFVQQIKVGDRTLLVYRLYHAPNHAKNFKPADWPLAEIDGTRRLAELPGKVEMKVTGAYGDWGPLTINYVDKSAPSGTRTLVIHSVDGTPWTQENQDSYDFTHSIAPVPRPKP